MTTTNNEAGVKPASDEEILARLLLERERVREATGASWVTICAFVGLEGKLRYSFEASGTYGHGDTAMEAHAETLRKFEVAKRQAAIEARVRAEMEASA